MIRDALPDAEIEDRRSARRRRPLCRQHVVSEAFRGKSRVQQHQMVYAALKGNMGGELHALALHDGRSGRIGFANHILESL